MQVVDEIDTVAPEPLVLGDCTVTYRCPAGPPRLPGAPSSPAGFVVDVRPAAGPRDTTSWSGLPATDAGTART
ncbi:MAG: hypothetical protein OHK0013_41310 [Sandaracinaceae bacterium]